MSIECINGNSVIKHKIALKNIVDTLTTIQRKITTRADITMYANLSATYPETFVTALSFASSI